MKECAVLVGKDQSLVGILTENGDTKATAQNDLAGVLLLNAGLIHRIGPNRIYVKMARMLASMGFVVLRFDFSGIGDSGPRKDKLPVTESMIDEMRQAMDYLEQFKNIKQFICIGLCDGATAAGQISVADYRVRKAVLIDPPVPENPQSTLIAYSKYYSKRALFNPHSWLKFLLMRSSYRNICDAVRMEIKAIFRPGHSQIRETPEVTSALNKFFQTLRTRGTKLLIVYSEDSEGDIGERYFLDVVKEEYRMMQDSGFLTTEKLNGTDHLVTPLASQEELLSLISKWVIERG
jgi:pimeloyl-ACP methyl ester carboxylesterase